MRFTKNINTIAFFILIIILESRCSRTAYVPNTQNIPMLNHKKEVAGSVGPNFIQAAYAATDHIGIIFNAESDGFFKNPTEDPFSKKHIVQLGGGYFNTIEEHIIFETYGGVGLGSISFNSSNFNSTSFSARQVQYFIQPSLSYKSPYVEIGLSLKFTGLDFYKIDDSNYSTEELDEDSFDLRNINAPFYSLMEPAVTIRAGSENLKMSLQFQHSLMLENRPLSRREKLIVFGINYNFNTKDHSDKNEKGYKDNFN